MVSLGMSGLIRFCLWLDHSWLVPKYQYDFRNAGKHVCFVSTAVIGSFDFQKT